MQSKPVNWVNRL